MGCSSSKIDIVITGAGTHNDFKIAGSIKHFGINFVRTNDESIDIGHGSQKVCLIGIFLKKHEFGTGSLDDFTHTVNRNGGKRLFSSYEYFHINAVSRNRS